MGHKVNPMSFRIGTIYWWQSQWYAGKTYAALVNEDQQIRAAIRAGLREAGVSKIDIERNANQGRHHHSHRQARHRDRPRRPEGG